MTNRMEQGCKFVTRYVENPRRFVRHIRFCGPRRFQAGRRTLSVYTITHAKLQMALSGEPPPPPPVPLPPPSVIHDIVSIISKPSGGNGLSPQAAIQLNHSPIHSQDLGPHSQCRLIAGWLAMSAQLVLLVVVVTALTIKRWALQLINLNRICMSPEASVSHACSDPMHPMHPMQTP